MIHAYIMYITFYTILYPPREIFGFGAALLGDLPIQNRAIFYHMDYAHFRWDDLG